MATFSRKDARIAAYELLFEAEIRKNDDPNDIFATAVEIRKIPDNKYIREVFFGVCKQKDEVDRLIEKYSKGWKVSRISNASLCAMRISIYEMLYIEDIPKPVSINEAIEITKKYDDKAKAFVNGILNSVMKEIGDVSK